MNYVEKLLDIAKEVSLSGFIDIAFITVFIYAILVLFKQSKARLIITGIVILGVIYLVAWQLNLVLTMTLLQAFFAVILLAVIIIFQEEIRRFFEQIAIWSLNPKFKSSAVTGTKEKEIQILSDTLVDLASQKIGALIVIKGTSPISGYLQGGEHLDGELSESLLKSLFDPNSIGHDGAVIIDRGRISNFSVHLPLSNDFSQLKNRGTRHAAALGLAEVTDALALVVSEERGTISIARGGTLTQVGAAQLKLSLNEFYSEAFPAEKKIPGISLTSNFKEKVIALFVAVLLWFIFVHESRLVYRSYEIPISHTTIVQGLKVGEIEPGSVRVTFLGPRREFYFFNENQVSLILKIPDPRAGKESISISESNLIFPNNLSLESIEPRVITVRIDKAEKIKKQDKNSLN